MRQTQTLSIQRNDGVIVVCTKVAAAGFSVYFFDHFHIFALNLFDVHYLNDSTYPADFDGIILAWTRTFDQH